MKGFLKAIFGLILIIFFIGVITFLIDNARISIGKPPIASVKIFHHKDGGTKEYYGIGYKIIEYNKLNGYKKSHIGTYMLKYDSTLGEESELAILCKKSVEKMNEEKIKNTVEFNKKEIKNRDKFFNFIDMLKEKDLKRQELNFIVTTSKGDKTIHTLLYENEEMFYTVDKRKDRTASDVEKEAVLTYEVEPLIKIKDIENKKKTSFYVIHKLNAEEILLVEVPQEHLKIKEK